jgi:cyclophilin family peptidyl-prolyl cis-trans isomerase
MSNPLVHELKNQKKLLFSLVGLVVVIIVGTTLRYGSYDLGGLNTYPGTSTQTGNSNTDSNNSSISNAKLNKYKSAPTMKLKKDVDYIADIETTLGTIEVDLYEENTPLAVNNFVFLSKEEYYDDLTFHYVKKGTLIQGGDPLGDGSGGPGYKFKDEIDAVALGLNKVRVKDATYLARLYDQFDSSTKPFAPENLKKKEDLFLKQFYEQDFGFLYTTGVGTNKIEPYMIAMANGGANSNGSQFFITTEGFNDQSLNGRHTVFGEIIDGFDVVDKIEATSVDANGKPVTPVKIIKIEIIEI